MNKYSYIKALRIDYYIKNILLIPGFAIAYILADVFCMKKAFLALLATCCAASANYVINEYFDRHTDKYHPQKYSRPGVNGLLKASKIFLIYILLVFTMISIASNINFPFLYTLIVFLILGVVYNIPPIRLKDFAYLDICTESLNNPLRFLLGWFAMNPTTQLPYSIVLSFWCAGIFLMSGKRFAEIKEFKNIEIAKAYRLSFKQYSVKKLIFISLFGAISSILFLLSFFTLFNLKILWTLPLIITAFGWYVHITLKPNSTAQRIESLYKEPLFLGYLGALSCLIFILARA